MNISNLVDTADRENKKKMLNLLEENKNAIILDCGCSDGSFTIEVLEKVKAKKCVGLDISQNALLTLRLKNKYIDTVRCDLNKSLPFKNESFDVIISNSTIEHIIETDNFIQEIFRILKWEGLAIVSAPNLSSLNNILFLVFGLQPLVSDVSKVIYCGNKLNPKNLQERGNDILGHYKLFTHTALRELFEYYGFSIEKTMYGGFYPFKGIIANFLSYIVKIYSVFITIKARKVKK